MDKVPYVLIYTPLRQPSDNSIVGMISIGKPISQLNQLKNKVKNVSLVANLVILFVGLGILLISFSTITRSIKKVYYQINDIVNDIKDNNGDLTKRIECTSKDEIGLLSESINDLLIQLQDIMTNVKNGSNKLSLY